MDRIAGRKHGVIICMLEAKRPDQLGLKQTGDGLAADGFQRQGHKMVIRIGVIIDRAGHLRCRQPPNGMQDEGRREALGNIPVFFVKTLAVIVRHARCMVQQLADCRVQPLRKLRDNGGVHIKAERRLKVDLPCTGHLHRQGRHIGFADAACAHHRLHPDGGPGFPVFIATGQGNPPVRTVHHQEDARNLLNRHGLQHSGQPRFQRGVLRTSRVRRRLPCCAGRHRQEACAPCHGQKMTAGKIRRLEHAVPLRELSFRESTGNQKANLAYFGCLKGDFCRLMEL